MTLGEALAELGIASGTEPEQARRAYLRLLKTRKPETDPEGFRRLREAYELVRDWDGTWRSPILSAQTPTPPLSVSTQALPVSQGDQQADDPAEPPAPLDDSPVQLTPLGTLQQLRTSGDEKGAAQQLSRIYADAARNLDVPTPPPRLALDLLLAMYECGSLDQARELDEAFRGWLQATGQEVRVLGGLAPTWANLAELRGLPPELSAPVRAVVARAIRTGEMQRASSDLRQIWARSSLEAGAADARLLRTFGGPLCASLAKALNPSGVEVSPKGNRWAGFRWVWIVGLVVSSLGRLSLPSTSSAPISPSYSLKTPRMHYASTMASALADDADRLGAAGVTLRARAISAALDKEECADAQYHADALEEEGVPSELAARVRAMKGALKLACPADAKERHSGQ